MVIRKKKGIFSIGINAHKKVDNLITLFRSCNDIHDGTIDYIYLKVLNLSPIQYMNVSEEEMEYSEKEIDKYEENFYKYENEETNEVLKTELSEVISFVRNDALEKKLIKEFLFGTYIESSYGYNANYIVKAMFRYYNEKKRRV